MQVPRSINEEWFYNQEVQRQENGKGYVYFQPEAITRTERIGMDTLMYKRRPSHQPERNKWVDDIQHAMESSQTPEAVGGGQTRACQSSATRSGATGSLRAARRPIPHVEDPS